LAHKNLVLILARGLADELASAMFVVDADGTLVYFNEGAEAILGRSFAEIGAMKMEEWAATFPTHDFDGRPLPLEELPLVWAINKQAPAHKRLRVRGGDEKVRDIAVTAFPLFARREEFVGAVAIFWEHPGESLENGGA
jgi:PAS domain-containing protein